MSSIHTAAVRAALEQNPAVGAAAEDSPKPPVDLIYENPDLRIVAVDPDHESKLPRELWDLRVKPASDSE